MRTLSLTLGLVLVGSLALAGDKKKEALPLPQGYTWETNYEQAKLKAAESGRLLYLDFYTDW